MKAIRKPGKEETAKRRAGELARQGLQVGRPLLWAPLIRRAEDCPPYLLVRDCSTRRAGEMDDFEALEAGFAAPFFKIGGRIIERVAEFDQHV
jgi:hypothetical protein